jgi:recombination protein RecA
MSKASSPSTETSAGTPPARAALETAITSITKAFGSGSIMRLGDARAAIAVQTISSGSISLDCALGVGGLARGRIVEIFGPESSGKTTLMLHAIASTQAAGGTAAFIDAEHAFDPKYARALGVNLDNLLISQPSNGEEALSIVEILAKSGAVDMIAVDSVAALIPKAELEGEMGMATMGMQARLMSQALRKLTAILAKTNTLCMFSNQLREKVGVMFGSPETTPGGKALKFYASNRLDIRRKETIKDTTGHARGSHVRVKVVKNKVAPPFCEAEFDIIFGQGIDRNADLLDLATELGIVVKKGAWFSYNGELIGQGRDGAAKVLGENAGMSKKITDAVLDIKVRHILTPAASETPKVPDVSTPLSEPAAAGKAEATSVAAPAELTA